MTVLSPVRAVLVLSAVLTASLPAAPQEEGRVIVLAFDGLDGRLARELMDAGQLPNLERLAGAGGFTLLDPGVPVESPVCWSVVNTGRNPGATGVPGYVVRTFLRGRPAFAFGHMERTEVPPEELGRALPAGADGAHVPGAFPVWRNPLDVPSYWDHAAEHGVASLVLRAPAAWDRPATPGARVLAGAGYPDARGGLGEWFVYTNDFLEFDRPPGGYSKGLTAGTVFRVDFHEGRIDTELYGPVNFWQDGRALRELEQLDARLASPELGYRDSLRLQTRKQELQDQLGQRTSVDLAIERGEGGVRIRVAGGEEELVREGEWSRSFAVRFELNPELEVRALTRFKLVELDDPHFELYVDSLDVDPAAPPYWQPLSQPPGFAAELAKHCGSFDTYGWGASATMPYKDGRIDVRTLLEDVERTYEVNERLTLCALERDDWRLFASTFGAPDRLQHVLYREYDPLHPLHEPDRAGLEVELWGEEVELREVVPAAYRRADRTVGRVLAERAREGDAVVVISDHGFESFRRQVDLNAWLAQRGYLQVKEGLQSRHEGRQLATYVDWSRTRAYAVGLGSIYVNLQGREAEGIVAPGEVGELLDAIRSDLLGTRDPETGRRICTAAVRTAEVHSGPHLDREGDLIVGFAPGYRIAWHSTAGGIGLESDGSGGVRLGPLCSDNDVPWSGGHVSVDPAHVPGLLVSNRRLRAAAAGGRAPGLLDVAPTVLSLLGVPVPAELEGRPLLEGS